MAGDEYLGIELSNRLQRINGAVLVMRKVGGSERGPTPLNVGWAVTSASPVINTPMLGRKKLVCPEVWPGVATGTGRPADSVGAGVECVAGFTAIPAPEPRRSVNVTIPAAQPLQLAMVAP